MNDTLIQDGLDLMLFGMGTVLAFLALLALATVLMSTVITRWFSEVDGLQEAGPKNGQSSRRSATPEVDDKVVAVIKAAIEQHRARRR